MTISFVSAAGAGAANGSDVSLTLTSLQQDDIVIVSYNEAATSDLALSMVTSGYTAVPNDLSLNDLYSDDTFDTNLGVFYKFMGATPDTSAVVNGSANANDAVRAAYMAFRGVDLTTPFDVTSIAATGIDTMHPNPASIDYATAGCWVVIACASATNLGAQTSPYTFPSGYTTNAISGTSNDTNDATCGMGYNSAPSDPEDPGALTQAGTDSASFSWAALTMALRPAGAAAASLLVPPTPPQIAHLRSR